MGRCLCGTSFLSSSRSSSFHQETIANEFLLWRKKRRKIRVKGFWLFCTRATDLLLPEINFFSARMKKKIRIMAFWGFCTIATNLLVPQRERERQKECSKKLKLFFFTLWDACTAV
jgi:hypothetical protein